MRTFKIMLLTAIMMLTGSAYAIDIQQLVRSPEFMQSITLLSKVAAQRKNQNGQPNVLSALTEDGNGTNKGMELLQKLFGKNNPNQLANKMVAASRNAYGSNLQNLRTPDGSVQSIIVEAGPTRAYSLQMNHMAQQAVLTEYSVEGSNTAFDNSPQATNTKQARMDYYQALQLASNMGVVAGNQPMPGQYIPMGGGNNSGYNHGGYQNNGYNTQFR